MSTYDRITVDPAVMEGQPCIRGQRLTVDGKMRAERSLARGWTGHGGSFPIDCPGFTGFGATVT